MQRHSLFFVDISHSESDGLSAGAKSFPTKNSSSKALPNEKCSERNTSILSLSSFTQLVNSKQFIGSSPFTLSAVYVVCTLIGT